MFKKVKEIIVLVLLLVLFTISGFIAPTEAKEKCNGTTQDY